MRGEEKKMKGGERYEGEEGIELEKRRKYNQK